MPFEVATKMAKVEGVALGGGIRGGWHEGVPNGCNQTKVTISHIKHCRHSPGNGYCLMPSITGPDRDSDSRCNFTRDRVSATLLRRIKRTQLVKASL